MTPVKPVTVIKPVNYASAIIRDAAGAKVSFVEDGRYADAIAAALNAYEPEPAE